MNKIYKEATCKGSLALGTACGHCERCDDKLKNKTHCEVVTVSENDKIKAILMDIASQIATLNPVLVVWFDEISEAIRDIK